MRLDAGVLGYKGSVVAWDADRLIKQLLRIAEAYISEKVWGSTKLGRIKSSRANLTHHLSLLTNQKPQAKQENLL